LKKRTKKLLTRAPDSPAKAATAEQKSFASFLQKRSAFFFLIFFLHPAFAETAIDQAHLKAAEALYEAGGYQQDMEYYVDTAVKSYAATIARRGGKPTEEVQDEIAKIVAPDFQPLLQQKRQQVIDAFAQHLSVEDMNATTAWCNSDAGRHFRAVKASMLKDIYATSRSVMMNLYDQIWKNRQQAFVALGLSFGGSAH
jgi:preprotein translocase subunit SecA